MILRTFHTRIVLLDGESYSADFVVREFFVFTSFTLLIVLLREAESCSLTAVGFHARGQRQNS